MSRPASESGRGLLFRLLLAGFLAIAPSRVPAWRLEPGAPRAAAMLVVGEPTPGLTGRGR